MGRSHLKFYHFHLPIHGTEPLYRQSCHWLRFTDNQKTLSQWRLGETKLIIHHTRAGHWKKIGVIIVTRYTSIHKGIHEHIDHEIYSPAHTNWTGHYCLFNSIFPIDEYALSSQKLLCVCFFLMNRPLNYLGSDWLAQMIEKYSNSFKKKLWRARLHWHTATIIKLDVWKYHKKNYNVEEFNGVFPNVCITFL